MKQFFIILAAFALAAFSGVAYKFVFSFYLGGMDSGNFSACLWGMRFDIAIAAAVFLSVIIPLYLFARFKSYLPCAILVLPTLIILLVQTSDALYALNAGKHITSEAAMFKEQIVNLTVVAFTDYWMFLLPFLAVLFFLFRQLSKLRINLPAPSLARTELPMLLLIGIFIIAFRGGVTGTPLKPSTVYNLGDNSRVIYAMNGAYSTLYNLFKRNTVEAEYKKFNKEILPQIVRNADAKPEKKIENSKYNVVLMLLESWPASSMGNINEDQNITPFLNRIQKEGLSAYAMIADGKRTHEGLFAALCSARNPLGEGLTRNQLNDYSYRCLPEMLNMKSVIFQGTSADLVGDLALQLGIKSSYGKQEIAPFAKHKQNKWGIVDEDLLAFAAEKAKSETEPFFYVLNTTTTHDITLPEGSEFAYGKETSWDIERSQLKHVDALLENFWNAFRNDIGRPTLFVFIGDHTRFIKKSPVNEYSVPFVMIATDGTVAPKFIDNFTSQLDVAPTVLDFLGGNAPWFQGASLYDSKQGSSIRSFYKDGMIGTIFGDVYIETSPKDGKSACYNYKKKPLLGLSPADCSDAMKNESLRAASETYYSQDLLFDGKTAEYLHEKR